MAVEKSQDLGLIRSAIRENPYEPGNYLTRAERYETIGFPDLAAGDAYKALLLSDEIQDDCGEYHDRVIVALEGSISELDGVSGHWTRAMISKRENLGLQKEGGSDADSGEEDGEGINTLHIFIADRVAHQSFIILSRTLLKCGCFKSAFEFAVRAAKVFPEDLCFINNQKQTLEAYRISQIPRTKNGAHQHVFNPLQDLPEQGSVRRELYTWNKHEPDRFAEANLAELNSRLKDVAPKCEVRAVTLPLLHEKPSHSDEPRDSTTNQHPDPPLEPVKPTILQLGLFATSDIAPNETVLHERSILAANNRLYDILCDACSSPLPRISPSAPPLPSCQDCEDTIFCSQTCHDLAMTLYHPAVCNAPDFDILAKDPSPQSSASALYLALLARALAMAQTQGVHPLDLPEVRYLWGDFTTPDASYAHSSSAEEAWATSRQSPFTFHDNILAPLHILEKMDVDVFANGEVGDTWVINTLYAKFRGTASARFGVEGGRGRGVRGPEVCAVHPMWSLANHSCAPNVMWEWGGEIRFVARGGGDVVRWGGSGEGRGVGIVEGRSKEEKGGIKKGEEILNHYCDVDLPVVERREWAVGTLGGICMCERCVWEDGKRKE